MKAGVPTTVYTVSLGGFDTHADEKGTQETQLAALDTAVSGFPSSPTWPSTRTAVAWW